MTALRAALLVHGAGGGGWEWNVWRGVFEAAGIAVAAPDLQPVAAGLATTGFDDYLRELRRRYAKVSIRKPAASRKRSPEVYALAQGKLTLRK